MGIRACIWPTGTPNPPAIAWSPPGPCLQCGLRALRQAEAIQRGLGSSRTLHHLRLPPRPAATGQIICLSQNNIPVVVRERVGGGGLGRVSPLWWGAGLRTCSFSNRVGAQRGKAGTLNRYCACFVAHTITEDGTALASFSWRARLGPLDTTEPLSGCPGALRLRKKEWGQILALNTVLGDLSSRSVVWTLALCTGGEEMEFHVLQVS